MLEEESQSIIIRASAHSVYLISAVREREGTSPVPGQPNPTVEFVIVSSEAKSYSSSELHEREDPRRAYNQRDQALHEGERNEAGARTGR